MENKELHIELNKRIYTKLLSLALALVLLITCVATLSINVFAQNDYVYDNAGLLSTEDQNSLREIARTKGEEYGISISFLTYSDAQGKSTMTYTDDFYDQNIAEPNGVLFAIDMDNREVYINTVGSCIENLSDSEIDDILDDTSTYASSEDYMDFFMYTLDKTLYKITDTDGYTGPAYNSSGYGTEYNGEFAVGSEKTKSSAFIPSGASLIATAVVMVVVLLVLLAVHNKNNKAPSAETYLNSTFKVNNRKEMFMGIRHEVIHDFYKQQESNGGGSSHMSSGGISHGGGGHGF